jgi:hypothetical protein
VERLSYMYIQISKQVHKLETKYSFLILYYIIIYDNDTCILVLNIAEKLLAGR